MVPNRVGVGRRCGVLQPNATDDAPEHQRGRGRDACHGHRCGDVAQRGTDLAWASVVAPAMTAAGHCGPKTGVRRWTMAGTTASGISTTRVSTAAATASRSRGSRPSLSRPVSSQKLSHLTA
jgi:hypothetical protein